MSEHDKNERKWAANIAFTGKESTVKALIKLFQETEERGGISDFTQINGPFERLQDLLTDRVKNLSLPSAPQNINKLPETPDSSNSDLNIHKHVDEVDMPTDDYDEDPDE